MLGERQRGESPSDPQLHREIYGNSSSSSDDSPSRRSGGNDGPGFIGGVVILIFWAVIINTCSSNRKNESVETKPAETSQASSPTREAAVTSPFPEEKVNVPDQGTQESNSGTSIIVQGRPPSNKSPLSVDTPGVATRNAPVLVVNNCIGADAYPAQALRADATGTTHLRLTVSPTGLATGAEVLKSAGPTREHRLLDRAAIAEIVDKCHGLPETDSNGNPVEGTLDVEIVWKTE